MRSRYNSPNSPTGRRDALNLAVFQRISGRIVSRRIIPINARLFKSCLFFVIYILGID